MEDHGAQKGPSRKIEAEKKSLIKRLARETSERVAGVKDELAWLDREFERKCDE